MKMTGQLHAPAALPLRERALGTHGIGACVGSRAGFDDMEKSLAFSGIEPRWTGPKSITGFYTGAIIMYRSWPPLEVS
jgi:hypothetical protein